MLRRFVSVAAWFGSRHFWDCLLDLSVKTSSRLSPAQLGLEVMEIRQMPVPHVNAIDLFSPGGQYTNASSVTYAVSFDQAVTGVAASDFQVVTTGSVQAASPLVVAGSWSGYEVTVNGVHGNGTLQLDLIDKDSIVSVDTSTPLGGTDDYNGSFDGPVYTIDQADPYVESIDRMTPSGSTTNASSVVFAVTFSEPVTGVEAGDFTVATTGSFASTSTLVSGSGADYLVTVSGISGNGTLGLNLVDDDVAEDTIHDLAGNPLVEQNASVTFQSQVTFAAGTGPFYVTSADVNGDGKHDLVVANYGSGNVSVLLGNGNGTFHAQQTYAAGALPSSVAVADVNGDGFPDIVVANGRRQRQRVVGQRQRHL